jgi:Ca2+-binding RTX toxin-like protein
MIGGNGNDNYHVDSAGDRIVEKANGGTDSVFTTLHATNLAAPLENLFLRGQARIGNGNNQDNIIHGNAFDNLLQGNGGDDMLIGNAGDDTLKGGYGSDTLSGGAGSDTYFVALGDVVHEAFVAAQNNEVDTVISFVSFIGGITAHIENIRLLGTSDINATRGDFATTAGELRGNSGNNILDGSSQAVDVMLGGQGDDIYVVENPKDRVIEGAGAGVDLVRSTVSHSLSAHVEQLELQGSGNLNGIGNGIANTLTGNAGNNVLNGREGNDTLTGGDGADAFVFTRALGPTNVATITDMAAEDTILLHSNVFTALSAGALPASALAFGTAASDADDRIIYDQSTGELYYDADGSGVGAQVLFAVLENTPAVTTDMFAIV